MNAKDADGKTVTLKGNDSKPLKRKTAKKIALVTMEFANTISCL